MGLVIRIGRFKRALMIIFTISLLYCYIFNPPFAFLPVGLTKFIYVLAFPFFMLPSVNKLYWNKFSFPTVLMLIYIAYSFVIHIAFSSKANFFQINCLMLFESFFTAYVIAYYLLKYYKDKADFMILWTTIIACIITLVLLVSPNLNEFVRSTLLVEAREGLKDISFFRLFGIADDLLFSYSIAVSMGLCICMQYAKQRRLYYCFVLLFFVGILFNARIGVIPFFVYMVYTIIVERRIGLLLKFVSVVTLTVLLLLNSGAFEEFKDTIEWIVGGFEDLLGLFRGELSGNFEVLSDMIIVPDTVLGLLFGTGENVFLARKNSDIGYILQLNFGGIIYILIFLLIVFSLYYKLKKYNRTQHRWFNLVFLGTFLICNIKGLFFFTCSGMRLSMILFFLYVLSGKSTCTREKLESCY